MACLQCSASCGRGWRYRAVQCKYGDNNVLKSYCDSADEPDSSTVCNAGPCPTWETGIWGLVVTVLNQYSLLLTLLATPTEVAGGYSPLIFCVSVFFARFLQS